MATDKVEHLCGMGAKELERTYTDYAREQERNSKERQKLYSIIIVLVLSFVLTNAFWFYYLQLNL